MIWNSGWAFKLKFIFDHWTKTYLLAQLSRKSSRIEVFQSHFVMSEICWILLQRIFAYRYQLRRMLTIDPFYCFNLIWSLSSKIIGNFTCYLDIIGKWYENMQNAKAYFWSVTIFYLALNAKSEIQILNRLYRPCA